jgi:type I restriction enzyme S subunit
MASEWPILTVAACAASEPHSTQIGPFGEKIRAEHYTLTGAPVLRGTNVNPDGRFHDDDFVFIESARAESEFGKFVCEADDVILCHKGTLGKIGIIPKDSRFKKYIMGNSMLKIRCDKSKLEPLYLYYWLSSQAGQDYLFSRVSQVGVPQIQRPLSTLREASLPVPPLWEQRTIAAMLGALDDKIELNRRMNATLEAMARALFQSWFVDFDPVRAKLDGRVPTGLDEATAALVPGHFEETALGHTPQGWEVRSLDGIANYLNGLALQNYPPGNGSTLPVIKIAQLRKGDTGGADRCSEDLPPEYIVHDGDLLFSWSGSLEVELWCGGTGALNQHLFKVTSADYPKWFCYLSTLHHLDEFRHIAAGKATTMGHIQRGHLTAAKVLVPPRPLLEVMTRTMAPLIERIVANRVQSRTLAALRDTLLPKLLSGELRVA